MSRRVTDLANDEAAQAIGEITVQDTAWLQSRFDQIDALQSG